ncbi:LysM peptidoglycan-binding domain-containing protein [Psychromonas sp. RZ22]|uniref:LysM peptidoglycan-binding domain-containing protein n=1 Tax=Psychromonas algarum TaxID=2555643 RepID=UPI0010689BB2|nr:LysM peptidoglycan-binding domain-containing protein [Psychromonas sp. RZ22]TEW56763.1 LysM peptidoglycan-binding domain-containing protein [Psychromonas sp. RZ22]
MKLLFSILFILLLSACQTIPPQSHETIEVSENALDESAVSADVIKEEEGLTNLVEEEVNKEEKPVLVKDYDNLWLKLAEGFDFKVPENSRVAKQRDYYLNHPMYLKKVSKRAEPFLWLIIEQIEAKKLPLELALLPVVESTFDPFAYSHAGASGLWQFMPVSGIRFGLHQDWWYDGRRDVYASTGAALKYMQVLHRYLGDDWLYAFAAYNSGEGRVKRSIAKNKRRNKPVDYWSLDLPKETENYVPKLLALIDILRNHEKYGVELPYIPNQQVLTYVDVESQIDLAYAAELAGLTIAEIQLLNPAFNHWATSPDGPHKLLLPSVVADQFSEKLAKVSKNKRIRWDRYIVQSGDSLSVIAQKNQTTTSVLKQINDLNGSFIKVGQALLIPIASKSQQQYLYTQAKRFEREESKYSKGNKKVVYKVVEGDTLWDISRRYKVTSKQIAKWNHFQTKNTLRLGQELTIWKEVNTVKSDATTRRVTYYVRSGDSLNAIAHKFNVSTADLVRWNNLQKAKYIKPGQKIKVYVDVRKSRT